jgi:hypothetical protein
VVSLLSYSSVDAVAVILAAVIFAAAVILPLQQLLLPLQLLLLQTFAALHHIAHLE